MNITPQNDDLRVLLIADDPLVRAGVSHLLDAVADESPALRLELSRPLSELHTAATALSPDVVLVDLGVTLEDARRSLAALGSLPGVVVALAPPGLDARELLAVGIRAGIARDAEPAALRAAVIAAGAGLIALDPALVADGLGAARGSAPRSGGAAKAQELTAREMEVLQLLTEALPNKLIADRLGISDHTAKFHVNSVMSKLSAGTRTEAVVRAARLGIVTL